LNVVLLNEEDRKNYSVFNTPGKPSTQYWKDRNDYIGGGDYDGKWYFKMTKKLFYISCKEKN
jgi:hypothetical protein